MSIADVEEILQTLDSSSNHAFSFTTNTTTERLQLNVKDVGEIKFPVNKTTLKKLIKQATPALFGHKDKTIYDPKIRNTWELDKSRVKIDMRKWKRDLSDVLDQMAQELFPEGTELTAELHNMLVYEPGQFFKKHQDSEKTEDMQASLVVMLPTKEDLKGGNLSIEHTGKKKVYGKKKDDNAVQYVGFYADCVHQVSKVTEGHRLALTFNVSVKTRGTNDRVDCPPELIEKVRDYFKSPLKPRYNSAEESTIFCILAHQYTPKSLNWHTLKGNDIAPALALKAAAESLGLEAYLGSFEYRITYDVVGGGDDDYYYGYRKRRRYRSYYDEDDYDDDEGLSASSNYETGDVINDDWSWASCINKNGTKIQSPDCSLYDANKIELGDLDELEVENEEYEGFMGNYGNTLDRLYHRAGVVIRDPQAKAFKKIVSDPLRELERIEKLKDENLVYQKLERYFPYAQCFPTERKVIEQIIKIGVKFKSPELLRKLVSESHYPLLFQLPAKSLASLETANKKVVDKMMRAYIKGNRYRIKAPLISLLKTCTMKPTLCKEFAYFMPEFINSVTDNIEDGYCFDREKYSEQVSNAAMILDFAIHAECFDRALRLLKHIQEHPLAYPPELFILSFPPNQERLGIAQLSDFYQSCQKSLSKFIDHEAHLDAGSADIPIDNFPQTSGSGRSRYSSSAPSAKYKELLSFLRSDEIKTRLQLFKKDQGCMTSFIRNHRLPVNYDFGSVSTRYYVDYKKALKTSKAIRLKRLKKSQEALALLQIVSETSLEEMV